MFNRDFPGTDHLHKRIRAEFAIAAHMDIEVEAAGADGIVIGAPLAANANYKGTAFGGSLFSVGALAGWAWLAYYLAEQEFEAEAVIQEGNIRYLAPVRGRLRATLAAPPAADIAKFRKILLRAGRARIRLLADIHDGSLLAAQFDGLFVAALRRVK